MIADSGTRMVVADARHDRDGPRRRRRARRRAGELPTRPEPAAAAAHRRRRHRRPAPGERGWDQLVADRTAGRPPVPVDPEALAVLLYTSGTSGRPRAAMLSHRALLANIEQVGRGRAADDHRRRRGARRAAALPRLRPQRRARPGAAPAGPAGARRRLRPGGLARPHRGRGGHAWCRWRRRSSPTGWPSRDLEERLGPVRLVLSGSAPLAPELDRRLHRRAPASPSTRATA